MKMSMIFNIPMVIHEKIYYYPNGFKYLNDNVDAPIVHKVGNRWVHSVKKITIDLANELKEYAESH